MPSGQDVTLDTMTSVDAATLPRRLHSACHHFRTNKTEALIEADAFSQTDRSQRAADHE
jgi:hypothetical protein